MKKINLDTVVYYAVIIVIVLLAVMFITYISLAHTKIAHFSIAASLLALRDNPLIKFNAESLEKDALIEQLTINKIFKRAIKKEIKNKCLHFILHNNIFIASAKRIDKN